MKNNLTGKCKYCLGCVRLEDENFKGSNDCAFLESPIEYIHRILGMEDKKR